MADTLANFAVSAVATAPSPAASGTSLVVTAAEGARFPSTAFYATICPAGTAPTPANAEIVRVTARSTDTLTIVRAQAGTSARTVVVGDQFFQCLPAEYFLQPRIVMGGTVTASDPVFNATQTWDNGAVAFTMVKIDVTNTASDAASKLIDANVASASQWSVSPVGATIQAGNLTVNGYSGIFASNGGCYIHPDGPFSWAVGETNLYRDVAYAIGQRSGTNPQTFNHYARHVSASDRNYLTIAHAVATLSSVNGATVTATNLIPAGAIVLGLTTRVTTALGTGGGTTGYQVGDGSDTDRWGTVTGTAGGTKTTNASWTTTAIPLFNAAQSVVITATGGSFNGTGAIYVDVAYVAGMAD